LLIGKEEGKDYSLAQLVVYALVSICTILAVANLFTLIGLYRFTFFIIIAGLILPLIAVLFLAVKRRIRLTKYDKATALLAFLMATLNAVYHHVTLWGGYDHAVYSCNAINIARTGSLIISFEGYPFYVGFSQIQPGSYTATFLPGYSVLLSFFYKLGGLRSMFLLNAFLLFFTLIILYVIAKKIANQKAGLIFIFLFSLHYTTLWFSRRSLAEVLMLPLLWLAFFLYRYGVEKRNGNLILASFIPLTLGLLVRFEVLLFLLVFILVSLVLWLYNWRYLKEKIEVSKISILSSLIIFINFCNLFLYIYRSKSEYFFLYLEHIWRKITSLLGSFSLVGTAQVNSPRFNDVVLRYVFDCFNAYLLIALILFIFIAIKKRKYNYKFLLLVVLAAPTFLLIRYPTISWVHPWFMRHYWAVLIPLIFLAASIGIEGIGRPMYRSVCVFIIVSLFIASWAPMLVFAEEAGMPQTLAGLHQEIGDTDAPIIVSLEDHKISEPLHFIYGYRTISYNYKHLDTKRVMEELEGDADVIVISRNKDTDEDNSYEILPDFQLYRDEALELVSVVTGESRIMKRVAEADRYVKPENINPKELSQGYQPVKETIWELPPMQIENFDYNLYIYSLKAKQGSQ